MHAGQCVIALCVVATIAAAQSENPTRFDLHGDPLPPGVVARIGTHRFWHGTNGSDILVTPDGKKLIAQCADGLIHVMDLATGKDLQILTPAGSGTPVL